MQRLDVPPVGAVETIDRRGFLNRTMLGALTVFGIAFGGASIASLWPEPQTGKFGSKINAGKRSAILDDLKTSGRPIYNPTGRFYLIRVENPDPFYADAGVVAGGLMALFQKCPHLGCRVPYCPTSGWFECPCHAAMFNRVGERMPGSPAPAGMWRFPIAISEQDDVIVDTHTPSAQPRSGFYSVGERPEDVQHCI